MGSVAEMVVSYIV